MAFQIGQSVSFTRPFVMVGTSDHVTGLTGATVSVEISKNGGAFAAIGGSVAEIGGSGNGSGWYVANLNTTDTNTIGPIALHCTASGADPTDLTDEIVVNDPATGTVAAVVTVTGNLNGTAAAVANFVSNALAKFPTNFPALLISSGGTLTAAGTITGNLNGNVIGNIDGNLLGTLSAFSGPFTATTAQINGGNLTLATAIINSGVTMSGGFTITSTSGQALLINGTSNAHAISLVTAGNGNPLNIDANGAGYGIYIETAESNGIHTEAGGYSLSLGQGVVIQDSLTIDVLGVTDQATFGGFTVTHAQFNTATFTVLNSTGGAVTLNGLNVNTVSAGTATFADLIVSAGQLTTNIVGTISAVNALNGNVGGTIADCIFTNTTGTLTYNTTLGSLQLGLTNNGTGPLFTTNMLSNAPSGSGPPGGWPTNFSDLLINAEGTVAAAGSFTASLPQPPPPGYGGIIITGNTPFGGAALPSQNLVATANYNFCQGFQIDGLSTSDWTQFLFTVKPDQKWTDPQSSLLIQISNPGQSDDGLLYYLGAPPSGSVSKSSAAITVGQTSGTTSLTVTSQAAAFELPAGKYYFDLTVFSTSLGKVLLSNGTLNVLADTLATPTKNA